MQDSAHISTSNGLLEIRDRVQRAHEQVQHASEELNYALSCLAQATPSGPIGEAMKCSKCGSAYVERRSSKTPGYGICSAECPER